MHSTVVIPGPARLHRAGTRNRLVTPTTIDARHFLALALRAPAVFALAILQTQLGLPAKNNTQPRNGEGKVALLKNKRPHPKVQPFGSPRS